MTLKNTQKFSESSGGTYIKKYNKRVLVPLILYINAYFNNSLQAHNIKKLIDMLTIKTIVVFYNHLIAIEPFVTII